MKKLIYCLMFFVTAMFCYQQTEARVLEINLEKMTRSAGKIVAGRCIDVKKGFHPGYKNVEVTYVTLEVFDVIKGDVNSQMTFMQFGHGFEAHDLPRYSKGEEVVLFLYPESQYGFTSPVGGDQGKFLLQTDPIFGERTLVKQLSNARFFQGVDSKSQDLSSDEATIMSSKEGPIKYDNFRTLVKEIIDQYGKKEVGK